MFRNELGGKIFFSKNFDLVKFSIQKNSEKNFHFFVTKFLAFFILTDLASSPVASLDATKIVFQLSYP